MSEKDNGKDVLEVIADLVRSTAKAMYEAPDPDEPDYVPTPWPPRHPDDERYWLGLATAAVSHLVKVVHNDHAE